MAIPLPGDDGRARTVLEEVRSSLLFGAVVPVPPGRKGVEFLFRSVPGSPGGRSLASGPKFHAADLSVVVYTFQFLSRHGLLPFFVAGVFLFTLVLPDVSFPVPVHPGCPQYLCLAVYGRPLLFRVLPFRLATSQGVFFTVVAPVVARLRLDGLSVSPYLAVWSLCASSPFRAPRVLVFLLGILQRLRCLVLLVVVRSCSGAGLVFFLRAGFYTLWASVFLIPTGISPILSGCVPSAVAGLSDCQGVVAISPLTHRMSHPVLVDSVPVGVGLSASSVPRCGPVSPVVVGGFTPVIGCYVLSPPAPLGGNHYGCLSVGLGYGSSCFSVEGPLVSGSGSALVDLEGVDNCLDGSSVVSSSSTGASCCGPDRRSVRVTVSASPAIPLPGSLVHMAVCLCRTVPSSVLFPLSVPTFGSCAHDTGLLD